MQHSKPRISLVAISIGLLGLAFTAGCTSLKNQLLAPRQNQQLAKTVSQEIRSAGLDEAASLEISARNGVVTLRGTASNEDHAERITCAVKTVQGVSQVENRLRLAEPGESGGKANRTLIEDVRVALEDSLAKRGQRLAVEADEGVVYLSGIVPDAQVRANAVQIAMNVEGVVRVEDNLLSEKP